MTEAKDYLDFLEQHRLMDDAQKYPLAVEYARSCEAEIARLRAEVERYKGLWLRGSERHAHAIRAQHEHNQTIIRELTGGQDGTNDD